MPDQIDYRGAKLFKVKRALCGFKGCEKQGEFQPELIFRYLKATNGKPLVIALEIEVCDEHRHLPKQAFISAEGYRHVLKLLRKNGYNETPELKDVSLQFVTESGLVLV